MAAGVVNDPAARTQHEVDVRCLAHIRSLLAERNGDWADRCRPLLFSGGGFADDLRSMAAADLGVQLVNPDRLFVTD